LAVDIAIRRLCPDMVPTDTNEWLITALDAARCASAAALVFLEENQ
jgi:hypothetical protein